MGTLHHPPPNPRPARAGELSEEVIFGALRRKSPLHILLPFPDSGKGLGDGEKRNRITLKIKFGVIYVYLITACITMVVQTIDAAGLAC